MLICWLIILGLNRLPVFRHKQGFISSHNYCLLVVHFTVTVNATTLGTIFANSKHYVEYPYSHLHALLIFKIYTCIFFIVNSCHSQKKAAKYCIYMFGAYRVSVAVSSWPCSSWLHVYSSCVQIHTHDALQLHNGEHTVHGLLCYRAIACTWVWLG